jgi:hypothetical protein
MAFRNRLHITELPQRRRRNNNNNNNKKYVDCRVLLLPAFFSIHPTSYKVNNVFHRPLTIFKSIHRVFLDEKKSINLVELLSLSLMFSVFLFFLSSDSFPFHSGRKKDGLARTKKNYFKGFHLIVCTPITRPIQPNFFATGRNLLLRRFYQREKMSGAKKKQQQNGTTTHEPLLKQK